MVELFLAFAGSFCAGVIFNTNKKNLVWAGLSGFLGWTAYAALKGITGSTVLSTLAGAVTVGIFSEIAARLLKTPSTIFSVTGIFPIVPGVTAYEAVHYLTRDDIQQAAQKAVETIASAGSIAFGILLATSIFRLARKITCNDTRKSLN